LKTRQPTIAARITAAAAARGYAGRHFARAGISTTFDPLDAGLFVEIESGV
jgi:hypothetical protein